MSTEQRKSSEVIRYTPLAESSPIELSLALIYKHIAQPTRAGKRPTESDCLHFLNLCTAQQLNPWTKDCWMLGYDTRDGAKFEIITAYASILKRADANESYDGMRGGIVVQTADGEIAERDGSLAAPGDKLIGGWAVALRRDRSEPTRCRVNLKTYDTGQSRWAKDPAGMIVKVAKCQALREAFPNTHSGLYSSEEMDSVHQSSAPPLIEHAKRHVRNTEPDWPTVEPETEQSDEPEPSEAPSVFELLRNQALVIDSVELAEACLNSVGDAFGNDDITAKQAEEIQGLIDDAAKAVK